RLEYDFVVAPGANPNRIHLRFDGVQSIRQDREGNLILSTDAGSLTQRKPLIYQQIAGERREVAGRFVVNRRDVSFALGAYDKSAPVVIDPVLSYATYLGGSGTDEGHAIAVDSAGNAYMAGSTNSTSRGDYDAFVRKINPTGTAFLYQASFGGNGDDVANAVAVDSNGNIFVAGGTASPDFPNPAGAFQKGNAGGNDAFVLRVNPNTNQLLFSTYFGGSGDDRALALALDPQGNVYITGATSSTDLQTSNTAFQRSNAGGFDAFVAKFDPQGNAQFGTYFGGGADDRGYGIVADSGGNVFLTGSTDSNNFPLSNAGQISRAGNTDAFITKMDPSGSTLLFSSYLGGGDNDIAQAIALDSGGNVYIAGNTASSDFPTVPGSYQTSYQGGATDIFVTKIQPDGRSRLAYSTYVGSHGDDFANGIAVDGSGQVYITGSTNSDQFPVTADAQQMTRAGASDVVVVKLDQQGRALLYSTFLGGGNDETGRAVAVDGTGNIYVTGITASNNFPATGQSVQSRYGGGNTDAFVAKISFPTTPPTINAGGVANGGSFVANQVSPGSLFSIFGTNFVTSAVSATTTPLPTSLGGISVTVNGIAAPLVYVGTNQINAQLPYEIQPGNATLVVNGPGGSSASMSFAVQVAAPGIFTANGRAVAQNQDFSLNTPSNPVKVGSVIVVYFTGTGPLNNSVPTGAVAPGISNATSSLSATIGGANANLTYVGLTPGFVGLGQANIVVPSLNTGDQPVNLTIAGATSNSAAVAVSSF
nr:SBBP repeat-containing protein [Acidobacteriota bacterium]